MRAPRHEPLYPPESRSWASAYRAAIDTLRAHAYSEAHRGLAACERDLLRALVLAEVRR